MSEQSSEWISLRDGERELCWYGADEWDRLTILACLSNDPRSLAELSAAWSRFQPDTPLLDCRWRAHPAPSSGSAWLRIDLHQQCFSRDDTGEVPPPCGAYQRVSDDANHPQRMLWINVPPWWRELASDKWSGVHRVESDLTRSIDFRNVLYGRAMIEDITNRLLRKNWNGMRPLPSLHESTACHAHTPLEKAIDEAIDRRVQGTDRNGKRRAQALPTERQLAADRRWRKAIQAIHAAWLMTPRIDLAGMKPRDFLHLDREWKDREVDQRRCRSREHRTYSSKVPWAQKKL